MVKLEKKIIFASEGDYISISINKNKTRDKSKNKKLSVNKFRILAVNIHGDYAGIRISLS